MIRDMKDDMIDFFKWLFFDRKMFEREHVKICERQLARLSDRELIGVAEDVDKFRDALIPVLTKELCKRLENKHEVIASDHRSKGFLLQIHEKCESQLRSKDKNPSVMKFAQEISDIIYVYVNYK